MHLQVTSLSTDLQPAAEPSPASSSSCAIVTESLCCLSLSLSLPVMLLSTTSNAKWTFSGPNRPRKPVCFCFTKSLPLLTETNKPLYRFCHSKYKIKHNNNNLQCFFPSFLCYFCHVSTIRKIFAGGQNLYTTYKQINQTLCIT